MARSLSLLRRRANLVDLSLQARPGVASYQFWWAANFDGAPALFETVPAAGKRSKTVAEFGYGDGNYRGQTRFLFNPADYSGLDDSKPLWLQIKPVSSAGVVGAAEALHLVLPYSSQPNRPVVLQGGVPAGAGIANSLELQLPAQCWNPQVQVDGTADLYLAFEPGGPEYRVPSLQNEYTTLGTTYASFSQLFLRGQGGSTVISLMASLRNNPIT